MGVKVLLHVYDVTKGMAKTMAPMLIGRPLDGVWHTGVEVFGMEYFFGGDGINFCNPGGTILGKPDEVVDMGISEIPQSVFEEWLLELSKSRFSGSRYHLLDHNCNTFSNELCQFLTGKTIPAKITNLPADVMNTPLGQTLRPFVDSMMTSVNAHHVGEKTKAQAQAKTQGSTQPKTQAPKKDNKKDDLDLD